MFYFICFFWYTTMVAFQVEATPPPTAEQVQAIQAETRKNCEQDLYTNTLERVQKCGS